MEGFTIFNLPCVSNTFGLGVTAGPRGVPVEELTIQEAVRCLEGGGSHNQNASEVQEGPYAVRQAARGPGNLNL